MRRLLPAIAWAVLPSAVAATCLPTPADVTADGSTNITDVQCQILAVLYVLGGAGAEAPGCIGPVFNQRTDHNCDDQVDVSDVQFAVRVALGLGVDPLFDTNGNACSDACEPVFVDCATAPNQTPCDDGDPCTLGDFCVYGACAPGSSNPCNDGDPCQAADCDSSVGCGTPFDIDCDDGDPCTLDACNSDTGECSHLYAQAAPDCPGLDSCETYASCRAVTADWTTGCHYNEGDCEGLSDFLFACDAAQRTCLSAGAPIPVPWICPTDRYGTGDGCDCDCGAPDPDCGTDTEVVFGCPVGQGCTPSGHCAADPDLTPVDCRGLQACAETLEDAELCQKKGKLCSSTLTNNANDCNALLSACRQ